MTKHNHKILFIFAYLAMPALLAWIGYEFSDFSVTKKPHPAGIFDANGNGETSNKDTDDQSVYKSAANSPVKFYDLPRVSLSMATNAGGTGTMKLDLSLEVRPIDLKRVVDFEPRIIEKILLFMRQQSFEEFQKPGGEQELRKGLEHEIRTGAFPIQIAAVDVRELVFE